MLLLSRASARREVALCLALALCASAPHSAAVGANKRERRRLVRFAINPGGARLILDGMVTPWFGTTLSLAPGEHRVQIHVPDSRCCEPIAKGLRVLPPAERQPDSVQLVVIHLPVRPARVTLVDAPPRAVLSCHELGLVVESGHLEAVAMTSVSWDGQCELDSVDGSAPRTMRVRVVAGEVNAVRWPQH